MQPKTRALPQPDTRRARRMSAAGLLLGLAALTSACGGAPERPESLEVAGTTEHIVAGEATRDSSPAAACEHGSVVECKVWVTETDCFVGLQVCDQGELSGCLDPDDAEALVEALDSD